ncbi:MAG: PH domain-containing protein [Selenomonadaceae bacterium]|nr:PH domain-containing protein [Selenomonadaceae bacterium]
MDFFGNDEKEILRFRKHWFFLAINVIGFIVGLLTIGLIVGIPLAFNCAYQCLRWWFDQLVLTNQAFYVRFGLISREIKRVPLRNIQDISFNQGFWGRIFGFGEVAISSAALGGIAGYNCMANPNQMVLAVSQAVENASQINIQIPNQNPGYQFPNQPPTNTNS